MAAPIFTVGHSTHSVEEFLELLRAHDVTALADVRSSPYSSYNDQFNREGLKSDLEKAGITYVFLGRELGAQSNNPDCYRDGKVQYDRLAQTQYFQQGLERLRKGAQKFRIAIMCAEKDPITCHRMILVCRQIRGDDLDIRHILEDGTAEPNEHAETRLMEEMGLPPEGGLFESREELLETAYDRQGEKIAYKQTKEERERMQDVR